LAGLGGTAGCVERDRHQESIMGILSFRKRGFARHNDFFHNSLVDTTGTICCYVPRWADVWQPLQRLGKRAPWVAIQNIVLWLW